MTEVTDKVDAFKKEGDDDEDDENDQKSLPWR